MELYMLHYTPTRREWGILVWNFHLIYRINPVVQWIKKKFVLNKKKNDSKTW